MNVSDVNHKRKRGNETSSKLWHSRLGHISKGRMECLIREEILPKLEFSDLDQCVDCIKGKFARQIKKDGAKRSSGILELIHTDIWGPFNVKSVMVLVILLHSLMISPVMDIFTQQEKSLRHLIGLKSSKLR